MFSLEDVLKQVYNVGERGVFSSLSDEVSLVAVEFSGSFLGRVG